MMAEMHQVRALRAHWMEIACMAVGLVLRPLQPSNQAFRFFTDGRLIPLQAGTPPGAIKLQRTRWARCVLGRQAQPPRSSWQSWAA